MHAREETLGARKRGNEASFISGKCLKGPFHGRPNKRKSAADQEKLLAGSRRHRGDGQWRWTPF